MFKDYVAVITGAGSGMAQAAARQFVQNHATVVGIDFDRETLEKTAKELGPSFLARHCDVSKEDQVKAASEFVRDRCGRADAVLNVAGVVKFNISVEAFTEQDFDWMFNIDVKGPMLMAKHFIPLLRKAKDPCIINIASTVVRQELPNHFLYSTAKTALEKFTRHLVVDYPGIRSNTILPGWTLTPMAHKNIPPEMLEPFLDHIRKNFIPCGRIASPDDIANVMLFLCSDKASYVNGASISVDGGAMCKANWGM
ncbi:MAG: SDR family oxidoreductase [bacterium]